MSSRLRATGLVLVLVAVHLLLFDRGLGGDGWATFATLESILEDGDPWVEDDARGVLNGLVPVRLEGRRHLVMQYPPGALFVDLAPVLGARALDRALDVAGMDGPRTVEVAPVGLVPRRVGLSVIAIVLGRNLQVLAALAVLAVALVRLGSTPAVATAIAATFFGGPLLFYGLVGMTHAPLFLLLALLFLLATVSWRDAPGLAGLAGLLVGCAVLVRYEALAVLPAVLLHAGRADRRGRSMALVGSGLVPPLLLLPAFWRFQTGTWSPPGYGGGLEATPWAPLRILFSPHHGAFLFHPALLFATLGLVLALWRRRSWSTMAAVWFLGVVVLNGAWTEWANAGGYGQRFVSAALPALAPGFAELLGDPPAGARRTVSSVLLVLVVAGYLLFFGAVGGLATAPPGHDWPQRLSDYSDHAVPSTRPIAPRRLGAALCHASFSLRVLTGCEPRAGPATGERGPGP